MSELLDLLAALVSGAVMVVLLSGTPPIEEIVL
jgi:hypothetical protein